MDTTLFEELLARIGALETAVGIGSKTSELSPANDVRLSKGATAKRYGVSPKTVERMRANPTLGFPQPTIVNNRWWFWLSELQAFDRMRARAPFKPVRPPQLPKSPPRRSKKAT